MWRDDLESLYFLFWDMLDLWPLPWDAKYKLSSDVKTANLLAEQSKRNQRDEPELTGEASIRNWRERVGGEADALVSELKGCAESLFGTEQTEIPIQVLFLHEDWTECEHLGALDQLLNRTH